MTQTTDGLPKRRCYPTDNLPNAQQIAQAKEDLKEDKAALHRLKKLEEAAMGELDEKKKQIQDRIKTYHIERDVIRANQSATLSYVAPIRRLPLEIYREIFLVANSLDHYGRTPWHVSGKPPFSRLISIYAQLITIPKLAVCRLWRRMALNIPNLWSHIRFHGSLATSPDLIRLWVERSGPTVLLDIDIEISRRRRPPQPCGAPWKSLGTGPHPRRFVHTLLRARDPRRGSSPPADDVLHRDATQWGHVALYYLTAQKHRWRSFVFESLDVTIEALQSLHGPFPKLQDFTVRCGDSNCRPQNWPWFIGQTGGAHTPALRNLTLDHVNFSWSSGVFTGLTNLRLHSPSPLIYHPHPASMDAVFGLLLNNPKLQVLDLSVQALQNSVLPHVETLALPELTTLSLEGAPHFISLLQHLCLERLQTVNIRFDVPQNLDFGESFRDLLVRSNYPPVTSLSVQHPYRMQETNLVYLESLPDLQELSVSRLSVQDLVGALEVRSPGADGMVHCPSLTKLTMQNCPGRRDLDNLMPKLVRLVEKRTDMATGGIKKPLEILKLFNCGVSVTGPQGVWLKSRLKEFVIDEYSSNIYPDHIYSDWNI